MVNPIRIGTRDSQLAVWQAEQVKALLTAAGHPSELVLIKSGGDIDLKTPLYEMGVQGIFTKELDTALLNHHIDVAVHSMKDVPTGLSEGIQQAAVLKRGPVNDLLVFKDNRSANIYNELLAQYTNNTNQDSILSLPSSIHTSYVVASSSIRRKAQWLHRFPQHRIENLRGNVNTRLKKLSEENWNAAIFAQAGLERINLRPENSMVIDWMLPAPSQGAIVVLCRQEDRSVAEACAALNDETTFLCTKVERDFLRTLLGGCTTPISALATLSNGIIHFEGNILSKDGTQKIAITEQANSEKADGLGKEWALQLLNRGGQAIMESMQNGK